VGELTHDQKWREIRENYFFCTAKKRGLQILLKSSK
jgi:hypothetical protein